ncbi:MAG: DegT/DnrJ/EryC1/StrS family aminotransferase [Planctomycetes bacterium]|nr:DegT/DnrJ/EryC1/StrS family aminotransferase [Planctomycetota bacterium]
MAEKFKMFDGAEMENLRKVVESQSAWRGCGNENFVTRFEDEFGKHLGVKYVLAISSGTAGNEAALAGVGIGPGDEVICTPCTFIASSMAILSVGAVPVFADVDPRTLVITAEAIEAAITPKAKAVVVVHLAGQMPDMDSILAVARKHNLAVVEDCAQAYSCTYRGKPAGSFGEAASFSLQQGKHMTSGEGGMVVTNNPEVYKRAFLYCNCGMPWYRYGLEIPAPDTSGPIPRRGHFSVGHNYRMTDLQGAVAVAQLAKLPSFNKRRIAMVEMLEKTFKGAPKVLPAYRYPNTETVYWTYPLRTDGITVAEIEAVCAKKGVNMPPRYCEVNYLEDVFCKAEADRRTPLGCPLPDYVHYRPGLCPNAEFGAQRVIPLFVHHQMADQEQLQKWATDLRKVLVDM